MRNKTLKSWSWHFKNILFHQWPRILPAAGLLLLSSGNLLATATVLLLAAAAPSSLITAK